MRRIPGFWPSVIWVIPTEPQDKESSKTKREEGGQRGLGFLAVVRSATRPTPLPSESSTGDTQDDPEGRKEDILLTGKGGRGGREAESHDREKAGFSINHSILFGGG
jgi:hypothetical protein